MDKDDIDAIQALYGEPGNSNVPDKDETPGKPKPESTNNEDLCTDSRFDTLFGTQDGSYYVFKGSNYWKLTEDSVEPGYPRKISQDWPGLPNNIDAAVTWTDNGKTYFFKGDSYWKFDNKDAIEGYPRKISEGFEGIPNDVDTAFVWGGNGKIYFFKGDNYWKFDPSRKPAVKNSYPKSISNWGLPANVGAAVQWSNKRTYFFKDGVYYRFNDRRFALDSGDPEFPRPTGPWWFGCEKDSIVRQPSTFELQDDDHIPIFILKSLLGDESSILLTFDSEGDELLDVTAPDE